LCNIVSSLRFKQITGFLLLMGAVLSFHGCDVTKPIPKGEYLLIRNNFKIYPVPDSKNKSAKPGILQKIKPVKSSVSKDELSGYLQQEPNSKLFGLFRSNIAFYNLGNKGKETKFKKWMRTKLGSAPVLLDTGLITTAKKQMRLYLANKGYFHAMVHDSIVLKKKKAKVIYFVRPNIPYILRDIHYSIADTQLAAFVYRDTSHMLLHRRHNFDTYLIDGERTRMVNALQDLGFFHFSATYIRFVIDSSFNNRMMDVTIEIRNPVIPSLEYLGTFTEARHERYTINKIMIYPEYSLLQSDTLRYDTLVITYKSSRKDTIGSTYYFLYKNKFRLKPRTMSQMIFIKSGTFYNRTDVTQTYSQLASLQLFNYMKIQFQETPGAGSASHNKIDSRILLSRVPPQSLSVSTDVTNSAGAFGLQGNLSYLNRNIFRGGQLFKINLSGAIQAQVTTGPEQNNSLFNTIELGINASLSFPQFLIPIRPESFSKKFKPRTTISLGYNFQKQPDYDRHITNASFGYSWNQNEKLRHTLNPAEVSMVKIFPDSFFTAYLDSLTDKRLKNQYTDHLVAGLRYTLTYNGQDVNKVKDFFYIRSNFETGGNLIYAFNETFKSHKTDSYYTVFGVPYSQFVRPDMDFRFYHFFSKISSLVTRFYGGIGIPYGNSTSLPFEKAFFAGGANDIRGWKMGTLGPGRYHNDSTSTYDQTGDMQLQVNIEYRFPVYKQFRSALFMDIGNVWLLHNSADLPGGKFEWNYFIPDLAIDVGIGLRADFDYFIVRFDPAVPVRIPYYMENNHWYAGKLNLSDIIWNFGIGYPF
jgi:outer membrane protein assembly factor BamA